MQNRCNISCSTAAVEAATTPATVYFWQSNSVVLFYKDAAEYNLTWRNSLWTNEKAL